MGNSLGLWHKNRRERYLSWIALDKLFGLSISISRCLAFVVFAVVTVLHVTAACFASSSLQHEITVCVTLSDLSWHCHCAKSLMNTESVLYH